MDRYSLISGAVFFCLVATAAAQETETVEGTEIEATAVVDPPPGLPEEPMLEEVPDGEKPARSREAIDRMREILSKVLKHLEEAREERDVVKLNCVNEKLTAVKGLLKISEQADVAMQEALARRNSEVADHEYKKIAIAVSKCEQLFAESEACVGELAVYSGETSVTVEEPEGPTLGPDASTNKTWIDRPTSASPYLP